MLEGLEITALYASPLQRAMQTADIISSRIKLPVRPHDALKERDIGTLFGKTWVQIQEILGPGTDWRSIDHNQEYDYHSFGGESVEDVKVRTSRFLEEAKTTHGNGPILVVTHGGILRLLHHQLRDRHVPVKIENASVHEFDL